MFARGVIRGTVLLTVMIFINKKGHYINVNEHPNISQMSQDARGFCFTLFILYFKLYSPIL